jgi:uncharacterized protein with von Willebrand factor type A (vWA) domain
VPERFVSNLLLFTRTLRHAGVAVRTGGAADAVRALELVGVGQKRDVRDALRTVLIYRHEDAALFDLVFERFWRMWPDPSRRRGPQPMQVPRKVRSVVRLLAPAAGGNTDESDRPRSTDDDAPLAMQTYSADEAWRRKDFADFTADDVARATKAMARLVWDPGVLRTRRWKVGHGRAVDFRRLLRVNSRFSGELLIIPRRRRRTTPRPLVLVCDISGSMEPYTRMLLLFAHAMAARSRRIEVFVFATRLTRVTRHFRNRRADQAFPRVQSAVRDWSGGTRIGDAIRAFNVRWARRVLRRRPVALLISDGWDLGDPALLAREVARLQRSVQCLIWLNPLIGSEGYEPLTRGLQAALPFVDEFLSVRNMSSLEVLAARLNEIGGARVNKVTKTRREPGGSDRRQEPREWS